MSIEVQVGHFRAKGDSHHSWDSPRAHEIMPSDVDAGEMARIRLRPMKAGCRLQARCRTARAHTRSKNSPAR